MKDTYIRVIHKASLADFAHAVNDEETSGTEFVKSSVEWYDNAFTNLAVFRLLDPPGTTVSGDVTVLPHGTDGPDGASLVWTGVVVVDGTNTAVSMFR